MVDTGCCDGIGAGVFTTYAEAIRPCTMRAIARIETIQNPLFQTDISLEELESRYTDAVRKALDGNGNFGFKSWGMKWHQMERLGVVKPHYDLGGRKDIVGGLQEFARHDFVRSRSGRRPRPASQGVSSYHRA